MAKAKRSSWKTKRLPKRREQLDYYPFFMDFDAEKLSNGYIPQGMEDKWFVYSKKGWVYFHRSWSGHCIFWMRLDGSPGGVKTLEVWANRESNQYATQGADSDIELLSKLIEYVVHREID